MNTKVTILILTVVVIILAIFLVIINRNTSQPDPSNQTNPTNTEEPTGIIVPTTSLRQGELDIVRVKPQDFQKDIPTNTKIEITFSREPKPDEITFYIGPSIEYDQEIKGRTLIITPREELAQGTQYTHSVNFRDDNQKIRLYKFVTKGTPQEFLPNTYPSDLIEREEQATKSSHPDIYLTNQTPYESNVFRITATFEPKIPAHFFFTVKPKIADTERVRQDVDVWLQSLDLTSEQISNLDIRYE